MKVNEIFYSFQGEGPFIGTRAVFLRLSNCNLNCDFCDTQNNDKGVEMSIIEVKNRIEELSKEYNSNFLIITGGEPLLQYEELEKLINLINNQYTIQFETNGTINKPLFDVYYVISPKIEKEEIFKRYVDCDNVFFKFVIENQKDIDFILELLDKYNKPKNPVYMQSEFSKASEVTSLILKNKLPKNIKITGQLHKYLNQI